MDERLRQRLEKVDEDLDWAGLEPEGMKEITDYTLTAIRDHIRETEPHATGEIQDLDNVLEIVATFLAD